MIRDLLYFIKENLMNLYILAIIYQLLLCIVTFTSKNFQVLLIEIVLLAVFIIIDNLKNS